MTFNRSFITSEDEGKLNWDVNNGVMYSVVNKDAPNAYGEYRGFKILPGKSIHIRLLRFPKLILRPATGNRNYLTVQNSSTLGPSVNFATNHLYAVQHHDNEPHSAYPYNSDDPFHPVVDFDKFFNGESLDQEDIVM